MPKLDVAPQKRRTIEIEFPEELVSAEPAPPKKKGSEAPLSAAPSDLPSAQGQSSEPPASANEVLELDESQVETRAMPQVSSPTCPTPEGQVGEATLPATEAASATPPRSSGRSFSEDETIKLLMDLASLQEDLERAREQTNSARRHVEIVQEQLSKTLVEKNALQGQLQKLMAEFDNYRRRAEREKAEAMERGKQTVLLATLEVLDNIERALATGRAEGGTLADFLAGVELIQRQVLDSLSSFGVEPIPAVGEAFDPAVHEAIATEPTDKHEPNTILAELKRGYKLGDRLLRPAMVCVAVRPATWAFSSTNC